MNPQLCAWDSAKYLIFSDNVFGQLIYYSHIPPLIVAIFFGIWIFSHKRTLSSGMLLSLLSIFSVWSFFDLIVWATEKSHYTMFFWSVVNMLEVFIYAIAVYFIDVFVDEKDISNKKKLGILLFILPTIILMPTSLNLMGYDLSNCNRDAVEGVLTYYNYAIELIYVLWILFFVVKRYQSVEPNKKRRLFVMTVGTLLFLLAFSFGNIAGTFTDDWVIGQIGLIGMPIFIAFLAYIIVKYKAFNLKLLATQALLVTLGLIMASLLVIRTVENVRIIVAFSLFVFLFIAIQLTKSVKRVDEQKEQIEKQATDLQKANDRLKELDKQKSEFVSFATHQLRSPLTSMKGYASLILEGDYGQISPQLKEVIERVYDSTKTLTNVVDDYLNISRIELGTMKYVMGPLDFKQLVNAVMAELKPNIDKAGLKISLDAPQDSYMISADPDKFKQVIMNVIDNSVKYTKQGSINLSLEKKDGKVLFKETDTGIGMNPEIIPKLFDKFTRANNANEANIRGTGLGLYVAKQIVIAHNGRIWAESKGEGKGSQFYVELAELK